MRRSGNVIDIGPLRPWVEVHAQPYDFRNFRDLGQFAIEVASAFASIACDHPVASARSFHAALSSFLRFITNDERAGSLKAQLVKDHQCASPDLWNKALLEWRSVISSGKTSAVSKNNIVVLLRPLIRRLSDRGLIPRLGNVLVGFQRDPNPDRSIGDITSGVVQDRDIEIDDEPIPGQKEVLQLASDLSAKIDLSNQAKIPKLLLQLLTHRIGLIRSRAEVELIEQYAHWERGNSLANECDLGEEELKNRYLACSDLPALRRLFTKDERGLARLLKLYQTFFGGLRPSSNERVGNWLNAIEQQYGGNSSIYAYLSASRKFLNAAFVIVLIDTAANVEAARLIKRDCLSESHESEIAIRMLKGRSRGHQQQMHKVPRRPRNVKIGAARALEMVLEATEMLRGYAVRNNEARYIDYVFISAERTTNNSFTGERVRISALHTFHRQFRELLDRIGGDGMRFSGDISLSSIRRALLLQKALETGSILDVQDLAKHQSTVTSFKYVNSFPLRIKGRESIFKFTEALQVLSTLEINDICDRLDLDKSRYNAIKKSLWDTGLGVLCRDPHAGLRKAEGFDVGTTCGAVDKCPQCPNIIPIIFATPDNVAHLILWHRHLKAQKEVFAKSHLARWQDAWEPWLVFTSAALEKLSGPMHKKAFKAGEILAETSPSLFPDLW